jgi:hypothetical protein
MSAVRLLLAAGLAAVVGASPSALGSTSSAAGSCPVTLPNHKVQPGAGFGRGGFNYGNNFLRAQIWPHGTLLAGVLPNGASWATINKDGSIWAKQGWWRGNSARLVITGRRLDANAPPLRGDVPTGYGDHGFVATGLTFPTAGCWQVNGKLGSARLTYVVRITKLQE